MSGAIQLHAATAALQAGAADTVYVAAPPGGALAVAADVAIVVVAVAIVVVAVGILRALGEVRAATRGIREATGKVETMARPVVDRTVSVAENVDYVVTAIRGDIERLHETVRGVTDRVDEAAARLEERIREFDALVEVIQDEAEGIFLDTASTVRGVREGARRYVEEPPTERPSARSDPSPGPPASSPEAGEGEPVPEGATGDGGSE